MPGGRWVVGAAVAAYAGVQWLGRSYGSTRAERAAPMPGDGIVVRPQVVATHATTIAAPPAEVWPWLAQVGWHRGGWYTARWVDRLLFPANAPSADRLLPQWQGLAVGDWVPDGPPETECGFRVHALEPGRHLVLHSTSHLPLSWRQRGLAGVDWTWVFALTPVDGGRGTRLVFRWRARARPWWLVLLAHGLVVPADLLMSRDMLAGFRSRCETAREAG